jgi:DNA adenine methylase
VDFICDTYENYSHYTNAIFYLDPPYFSSTGYKGTVKFDHDKFWDFVRELSKKNEVFISEYIAPDDFECVWQGEVKTNFASKRTGATHTAIEKLFKLKQ